MLGLHDRFTVCVGAAVPEPVRFSMVVVDCALLEKVSAALTDPLTFGLNVTVKGTDCPAAMVTGNARPPMLNTELLGTAPVTVTAAPLALRLPEAVPLAPTTTLPRPKVPGLTLNCPTDDVPVPETEIESVGSVAVDVTVTLPFAAPAVWGENATLKVAL